MKVKELTTRIEALPEREKIRRLTEVLKKYADELPKAKKALTNACAAMKHGPAVFPGLSADASDKAVERAAAAATNLSRMLAAQFDDIRTDAARNHVLTIVEQSNIALREVRQSWATEVEKRKEYEQLVDALTRSQIAGASELSSALKDFLRHANAPPLSDADTKRVRGDVEVLHLAVEKLGMEERARKFLIEASRTGARLEDVDHAQVRKMFNAYPQLRRVLRVRLG
jgi:hypothetical protein